MENRSNATITVEVTINRSIEKVWKCWTTPSHITKWNNASDDWHTPRAETDLVVGGKFCFRMEAKDGSFGFDFEGIYEEVKINELISYKIGDGRHVKVAFVSKGGQTTVVETFEAEQTNTHERQRGGWQAILENFKKHTESLPSNG